MNLNSINAVPSPCVASSAGFARENSPRKTTVYGMPSSLPEAARTAYIEKRAEWSRLKLRQQWADEGHMRGHITRAGLRSPHRLEPATVARLRALLRRVDVDAAVVVDAVGANLAGFLALNPLLPLWAALALVLESSGKFAQKVR